MSLAQCPEGVGAPNVCFTTTLPAAKEPPASLSVFSAELGSHADHLMSISGTPENPANPPVASPLTNTVKTTGTTTLANQLPLNGLIVQQPANGSVTLVAGQWIFTANAGATTGADSFQYVVQDANLAVSNVARGSLTLAFTATAPTVVNDQFAAQTRVAKTLRILANDSVASTNPQDAFKLGSINPPVPSSIVVSTPSNRGTIGSPIPLDGSVVFTAQNAGSETFTYSVTNSATPANRSANATVTLTNFATAEAVAMQKALYTIASGKWVINGTTNWFGPNLTQTIATCWTGTDAAPTASTLIGTGPVLTTGAFTVAPVGGPVGINNGALRCATSNGGLGASTTTAK